MYGKLITKIAKMVTVDYCRLTFVENPDGFLLNEDVCRQLRQEQPVSAPFCDESEVAGEQL